MQPKIELSEILSLSAGSLPGIALVDDVIQVLQHHRVLTPQEVARVLEAPKRELSSAIRLLTGVSLDVLVREYRKHQAIRLLADTQTDYDQVAQQCGFSTLHNLSLFLNRETGLTAYEWRERCSNSHRYPEARAHAQQKLKQLRS